ncbi:5' exonuclease Apollo-like [Cyprinodon tularosa]|uniref:5' exonuclease Apollo-like n=1 Tax=Cyprinodon tularosa TaxID=77115 RepID=UPI0018E1F832|nr:5' exonuclease Apollo-like [Cyprinodon tularosa]
MPYNGHVIPDTPLAVDFWYVKRCPHIRLFFLTHMHSDHTMGLTSTWSHRPIYCSRITADLLKLKLEVEDQWIHPLEHGEPYLLPMDETGEQKLTVTLIDANHCPGAVMFLFEGYFGSILYTGDFRYSPSMLREPCLMTNAKIDILYLDNTHCDLRRTLPSRQEATQQIKEIIHSHPDHNIVIGLYSLGKECLLEDLAVEFKTWVEVSNARMKTLNVLKVLDVFTTERGAGRIRALDRPTISSRELFEWNEEQPTLAILPTGRSIHSNNPNIYIVPYSDHSSYEELEEFVSSLKPSSLKLIVEGCLPEFWSALLPHRECRKIHMPDSVRRYMLREPGKELTSSTYQHQQPSLFWRKLRRLSAPKGVIFETLVQESTNDEACKAESVEQDNSDDDSDCIIVE